MKDEETKRFVLQLKCEDCGVINKREFWEKPTRDSYYLYYHLYCKSCKDFSRHVILNLEEILNLEKT